jgi:hypothetical protein
VIRQIHEVSSYVGKCDDWMVVKKEIMKNIPSDMRKLFSRRDPITKDQTPNDFDREVIEYYYSLTDIRLKIRTLEERRNLNIL